MTMSHTIPCDEVIRQLFDYLHGELDAGRHVDIERHLEECRACFSRMEFERLLKQRLAELGQEEAPASLRFRVDELLRSF